MLTPTGISRVIPTTARKCGDESWQSISRLSSDDNGCDEKQGDHS